MSAVGTSGNAVDPRRRRMWFLEQVHGPTGLHHIVLSHDISGTCDVAALAAAVAALPDNHPVLRTGFRAGPDGPEAVVSAGGVIPVEVVDAAGEADFDLVRDRTAWAPFDLRAAPLARAVIIRASTRIRLVLAVHHLVADGHSLTIWTAELERRYAALTGLPAAGADPAGRAPVLIAPRRAADPESALAFWCGRLAGVPTTLALPPAAGPGGSVARAGAEHRFGLDGPAWRAVGAVARAERTTPFVIVLAAYQALLARWTRQDSFVVGTPIGVRDPAQAAEAGLFVETLPLPARVDRDRPFRDLVAAVHRECAQALGWPHVPWEALLERLGVERAPDRPPLVRALFSWQDGPPPVPLLSGAEVRPDPVPRRWAKFDLTLEAHPDGDGLSLLFEYAREVVDAPVAGSLAESLVTLLADAAADPGRPVGDLALLSPAQRAAVEGWNATGRALPEVCLHELVAAQSAATPEAVAVVAPDRVLTYAALDAEATALAARLRAAGVGPGGIVAVCLPRSAELVVALNAVLKAGGAYVPLDPDYPSARLDFMLADCGAGVVISGADLAGRFADGAATVVVTGLASEPASASLPNPVSESVSGSVSGAEVVSAPDDLAYVIYTSGSTGRPKGAMNSHRGVVNRLLWMRDTYQVTPSDAVLQKTSASFDVSVWELFLPLISGARLVLAAPGGERDPAYLADLMRREAITIAHFVPSMFAAFLAEPGSTGADRLRLVVCSGEALSPALAATARTRLRAELHNLYGPTEAAIDVTAWDCAEAPDRRLLPIGRPVWNTALHVLDDRGRPLPPGFPGELFLSGVQVAAGYLGRPELTAERFPEDLFADGSGVRAYRTGDLVCRAPDGCLDYLGRLDHQVKIRGFRVEPGEVEAALVEQGDVRSAVVLVRDERLLGYVIADPDPETGRRPEPAELLARLAERLPAHLVPAAIVPLTAWPLTPNGKLDRAALPDPAPSGPAGRIAPRTPEEAEVAAAWAWALGHEEFGVTDDFFAVGGDSIRVLRAVGRLRERGWELPVRAFYASHSIRAQVPLLTSRPGAPEPAGPAPFELVAAADRALMGDGVEDAYPLTALQTAMLFHSEQDPAGAVYHDVLSLRVRWKWDAGRFAGALRQAAREHPVLRTSFDFESFSEPLQLVRQDAEVPLEISDWRGLTEVDRSGRLVAWLAAERARRFDAAVAPLLRVFVHLHADDVIQLTVSFHHAVLDGWSLANLVTGLLDDPGDRDGHPAVGPRPGFAWHVAAERRAAADPDAAAFWSGYLAGADLSPVPRWDPPRRRASGQRLVRQTVAVPAAVEEGLRTLSRSAGVPVKSVLVEAHATVMGLLTGSDDVVTGLVTHGRPEAAEADRLLGLFLTPVPLRRRLDGAATWADRVRAAFDGERAGYPHRRHPAARIQATLGGTRPFETLVGFNHFHVYDRALENGAFELLGVDEAWEETDLTLVATFVQAPGSGLRVELAADGDAISARQLDATAELYRTVLAAMARNQVDVAPAASLVVGAELDRLLTEWGTSAPAAAGPYADADVPALVARQAERHPERVAVDYADGTLTYRALGHAADRWAARLAGAGVRPGDRVVVLLRPRLELVPALLGVLHAGAAYVPLDPDHPAERWRAVVADAEPAAVIAELDLAPGLDAAVPVLTPAARPDPDATGAAARPVPPIRRTADPEAVAYVVYTSGSTGRPKGVAVPHRGITRLAHGAGEYARLMSGDRVGQAATAAFDAATFEVWATLAVGGCVVGVDRDAVLDPDALAGTIRARRIDVLFLTTAVVHETARRRPDAFEPLKTLLFGGEQADPVAIRTLAEFAPPEHLVHVYGPTETTTFATWHPVSGVARGAGSVPIGRPIPGTDVLVVGPDGSSPVPPGAAGMLLIGGPGVAAGYLGSPETTAERFVPHPLDPKRTVYRTGDVVRWNADGRLEFVGRRDQQVKIRGFRVEPGEVEAVLGGLPGVERAVVVVRAGLDGAATLVGYAVGSGLESAVLIAGLAAVLPRPMVPSAVLVLAALPLTANGKVDRAALPDPGAAARRADRVGPETDDERRVAEVWAAVLRDDAAGVVDDFFDVGGHSLLLAQLAGRLRAEWDVRLPLATLLELRTIREQARELRRLADAGPAAEAGRGAAPGLVTLRPGRKEVPPLILVHPVGGTCAVYDGLARALGGDRRILGLQAPGVDGEAEPLRSIEALADHHLRTLRSAGAEGPLLLAGMSMGGTIAFEMGRRLAGQGTPPALIALLDTPGPGQMPRRFADDAEVLAAAFGPEGDAGLADRLRALAPADLMRHVLSLARGTGALPGDFELVDLETFLAVWKAHTEALYSYVPRPYSGVVHYFRAQDTVPPHPAHPERPWQVLLGQQLRVLPVPGDHQSMVEPPHVATLAGLLDRVLDDLRPTPATDNANESFAWERP